MSWVVIYDFVIVKVDKSPKNYCLSFKVKLRKLGSENTLIISNTMYIVSRSNGQ